MERAIPRQTRALICGAGIAGPALAGLVAGNGWRIQLVERAAAPREAGYMVDFLGPGYAAAEEMGLLPRLRELAYDVVALSYVDRTGRRVAGMSYEQIGRVLQGRMLSLMRSDLARALLERLDERVEISFDRTVRAVEQTPDEVGVMLSDGTQVSVDLLVGADGIHSAVRELAFGSHPSNLRYLGFHTAAYTFHDPKISRLLAGRFMMTDSIDRAVGLYGIRDGQVMVWAIHRSPDPALPEDPRATLKAMHGGLGWIVPEVLARCPPPPALYYDQVAQVELPQWSRGRVTLVGDAGLAVSLLAGQGASLAVASAKVLADELAAGGPVPDALVRYQHRLAPFVRRKQTAGRRTAGWFLPSSSRQLLLRRLALRAMGLPGMYQLFRASLLGGAGRAP